MTRCAVLSASTKGGRGLFAIEQIAEGTVVTDAHVILVPFLPDEGQLPVHPADAYVFEWEGDHAALALGPISFINHSSSEPNCAVEYDYDKLMVSLVSLRLIEDGEELLMDYGCKLWFEEA